MSNDPEFITPAAEALTEEEKDSGTLRLIGWFSIGMAVAAIGIYVGRELRIRYKFNRRTPYDFYAKSAEAHAGEFGVGI